jgi:hypothetical protein
LAVALGRPILAFMAPADPETRPLSALVGELSDTDAETVTLGEVVDELGASALAGLLLIFGLACALPLPPGATTVFGLPLLLLAPQLVFDNPAPWLPRPLRERRIASAELGRVLARVRPWLERMERLSRPRLGFVVGPRGRRLIGVICTVLALVLILPIPLGNMLPAATVSVFSLSLIQRDGVVAVTGYVFAAASVGVLALAGGLIAALLRSALSVFALA